MSLNSETVSCEPHLLNDVGKHEATAELFVKPTWLKLDALVTSLLDIDHESEKFRVAMKHDLRLVALAGISLNWDSPQFAPYRAVSLVLTDMHNACR